MNPLDELAEHRLREAIEAGVFERLPGMGRPLELDDLSRVPEDLRASYVLLKGSGYLPEEMELKQEVLTLTDLLRACEDEIEAASLRERRDAALLRFRLLMERRRPRGVWADYAESLETRLGGDVARDAT